MLNQSMQVEVIDIVDTDDDDDDEVNLRDVDSENKR